MWKSQNQEYRNISVKIWLVMKMAWWSGLCGGLWSIWGLVTQVTGNFKSTGKKQSMSKLAIEGSGEMISLNQPTQPTNQTWAINFWLWAFDLSKSWGRFWKGYGTDSLCCSCWCLVRVGGMVRVRLIFVQLQEVQVSQLQQSSLVRCLRWKPYWDSSLLIGGPHSTILPECHQSRLVAC